MTERLLKDDMCLSPATSPTPTCSCCLAEGLRIASLTLTHGTTFGERLVPPLGGPAFPAFLG